jgi:hypothetical protein
MDGDEFEIGVAGCDAQAKESQKECDGWKPEVELAWESGGYEDESYAESSEDAGADSGRGEIWRGLLPSPVEHASFECPIGSDR